MKKIYLVLLSIPGQILYLLSMMSYRDQTLVLFGVHTNTLFGNVKALLEDSGCRKIRKIFIGKSLASLEDARSLGLEAYGKYSPKGIWYSLRAGYYVYSSYPSDINYWLSGGVKYINVWHGTPIKKIERDVSTGYYGLRNRFSWLYHIIAPYFFIRPNAILVASEFEKRCFMTAFSVDEQRCIKAFPPRLVHLKTDKIDKTSRKILYVPTWRDDHSFVLHEYVDLTALNTQLSLESAEMYVKAHPADQALHVSGEYSHIHLVDKDVDVYTLLAECDLLVTDYSSMMFEAFYLGIAVILFCPDLDHYRLTSRKFYIDPCHDLPVTSVYSETELWKAIISRLQDLSREVDMQKSFRPYEVDSDLLCELITKANEDG